MGSEHNERFLSACLSHSEIESAVGRHEGVIACKLDSKVFYVFLSIMLTVLGTQAYQLNRINETNISLNNTVATLSANQKNVMSQQLEQAKLNYQTLETQAKLATTMGNLGERMLGLEKDFKSIADRNIERILKDR
jgi:hypothetical protein